MQGMDTLGGYYQLGDGRDRELLTEQELLERIIREQESALRALAEIALRIAPRRTVN